ncbi:MAG: hypothetical protein SFW36_02040 [Leptolyngbyaceae cyanobacterium bins.59]|nr:hypothetical protein [Leptolyngbyaceae cyanobacterium bins.59]
MPELKRSAWVALVAALAATPVLAQTSNFGSMKLAPGFSNSAATAQGFTSGSFSLASIANRDRNNNLCLGYAGDRDVPDHVMTLEQSFSRLTVQANSRGNKPTLLIRGPGNVVRCGEIRIEDTQWGPGDYAIWVGSAASGQKFNYTLAVRE